MATATPEGEGLVLLIEDNDSVAGLVAHILAREQRQVVRVKTGADGVRTFMQRAGEIGLVILDCKLPDSEGTAICRLLRRGEPELPVLFTSGRGSLAAAAVVDDGRTDFLAKPFRVSEVSQKVGALLNSRVQTPV
ncbi:MAG TPA: response regulator [Opitutaceae bacterium]